MCATVLCRGNKLKFTFSICNTIYKDKSRKPCTTVFDTGSTTTNGQATAAGTTSDARYYSFLEAVCEVLSSVALTFTMNLSPFAKFEI